MILQNLRYHFKKILVWVPFKEVDITDQVENNQQLKSVTLIFYW